MKNKKNNKKKLKNILEIIFIVACIIGAIIYIVLTKNYEFAIKILIRIVLLLIPASILLFMFFKEIIIQKRIKKYYDYLKTKEEKTLFEECCVLTYQNKLDDFLKAALEKKKIKNINSLSVTINNHRQPVIFYKYTGFEVYIYLTENNVFYKIDSPTRYDGIKDNIELEKLEKTTIDLDSFILLDDLIAHLVDLIYNINLTISTFTKDNIVDDLFNGRLLDKLKDYLSFLKREGWLCTILSIPLTALFAWGIVMAFTDVSYKADNPAVFYLVLILCPAFVLLFTWAFFHGIKCLIRRKAFYKDFEQKRVLTINQELSKITIDMEKPGKHSSVFYLTSATLYFKGLKLILPLPRRAVNNPRNKRKCYNECLKVQTSLKYLPNSKIIVDGADRYINIINKHLYLDL